MGFVRGTMYSLKNIAKELHMLVVPNLLIVKEEVKSVVGNPI